MTDTILRNVPISAFLAYLAAGWKLSERGGQPAYQDTHHGRHGVLLYRPDNGGNDDTRA